MFAWQRLNRHWQGRATSIITNIASTTMQALLKLQHLSNCFYDNHHHLFHHYHDENFLLSSSLCVQSQLIPHEREKQEKIKKRSAHESFESNLNRTCKFGLHFDFINVCAPLPGVELRERPLWNDPCCWRSNVLCDKVLCAPPCLVKYLVLRCKMARWVERVWEGRQPRSHTTGMESECITETTMETS